MSLVIAAFMVFNLLWWLSCLQTKWETHINLLRLKREITFGDRLTYLPLAPHRANCFNFQIKSSPIYYRQVVDSEADTAVQGVAALIYCPTEPPLTPLLSPNTETATPPTHQRGLPSQPTSQVRRPDQPDPPPSERASALGNILTYELLEITLDKIC